MAYVPNILKKGYAPAWQPKTADRQHDFQTMDGTEYIVYVPSSKQTEAYAKSLKKYKDVFDQIKADIKDNTAIAKNKDGLPNNFDHVEWAEILSSTLKKLNKTWSKNEKIWIRNKNDDGTKSQQPFLAVTPKITERNAKRAARKVNAAAAAGSEFIVDPKNVTFGPSLPPITQYAYVVTKIDGLTYYYHTEKDVDKDNHFMIKNAKGEHVDKNGEIFDPDEDFRRFVQEGQKDEPRAPPRAKLAYPSDDESEDGYEYESDNERNDYDYNDGIPPYEGATWDDEFQVWVSDPFDMSLYDEEGNYKIPPEDIIVEPEPAPMPAPVPMMVLPPPPARPAEDPRIVEARIGLPPGWEPLISKTKNKVYYFNPKKGNQFERPTMGGKRTRRRPKAKSRAKQPKRKRTTMRRKRTTTRRK